MNPLVDQGWVPSTCELTTLQAGALLPIAIRGADPCAGCNYDRKACHGRPKGGAIGAICPKCSEPVRGPMVRIIGSTSGACLSCATKSLD